jgi:hypothetical protein
MMITMTTRRIGWPFLPALSADCFAALSAALLALCAAPAAEAATAAMPWA